jgi:hypothetical protein
VSAAIFRHVETCPTAVVSTAGLDEEAAGLASSARGGACSRGVHADAMTASGALSAAVDGNAIGQLAAFSEPSFARAASNASTCARIASSVARSPPFTSHSTETPRTFAIFVITIPPGFARVAIDDRYPNRRLVADLYRYEEPEAVKEFEGVALEAPDDPTIVWWTKRLLNIIERRQFEASNPAEAAARKATARGDAQAAADEIEAQRLAAREKRTAK